MPRPRIRRRIRFQPDVTYFKPAGVRMTELKEAILTFDESEAVRLVDFENVEQGKAAKQMHISQPTLSRLLRSARKKIADAIIHGKAIKIHGGNYKMAIGKGMESRQGRGLGRRRGRAAGPGPGGFCICPKCGHKQQKTTGIPCLSQKCPKCGTPLVREGQN